MMNIITYFRETFSPNSEYLCNLFNNMYFIYVICDSDGRAGFVLVPDINKIFQQPIQAHFKEIPIKAKRH